MKKKYLQTKLSGFALFFAATVTSGSVFAAPATALKPDSFAYGFDITTPNAGPLFKLNLPENVYRSVKKEDLGDIRVFNAQGDVVPHNLDHEVF